MSPVAWFCARCGKIAAYGEDNPERFVHTCESPFRFAKLPYVVAPTPKEDLYREPDVRP